MYGYVLYRVYIKCLDKFKSGFTTSTTRNKISYKHRPECTGMFYTGSTKHKWTNPTVLHSNTKQKISNTVRK